MKLMTILRRICDGLKTEIFDRQKSLANIVVDFGAKIDGKFSNNFKDGFSLAN